MREEENDEGGDAADGNAGAAESCSGGVERVGVPAIAGEESGEDGERADESEELEPLPLGEKPVVAGLLRGDDGGGFGGGDGVEDGSERESGEGEDGVGEVALAQASEAQNEDEGEGVGRHQGMEGRGEDEAERGDRGAGGSWSGRRVRRLRLAERAAWRGCAR